MPLIVQLDFGLNFVDFLLQNANGLILLLFLLSGQQRVALVALLQLSHFARKRVDLNQMRKTMFHFDCVQFLDNLVELTVHCAQTHVIPELFLVYCGLDKNQRINK